LNSKTWPHIIALALFAALAMPIQLIAQDEQERDHKHHHYQLVDLGSTFGGSASFFNPGSGNDFAAFTSVLNTKGTVAGFADTSLSDPFPTFCFWDCNVVHAFRARRKGDLTDLGALPGGGSSAPTWIATDGLIAGVSENGETDPLYPDIPEFRAVLWERGKITDLGTLPAGGNQSEANSVNNEGHVVGAALNTIPDSNSMQPATFWLPGGPSGYQYQTRAFLWDKQNGMQDLGTLAGGTDAEAMLINERGQVVGNSYTSSAPSTLCAGAGFALTTGSFIWDKRTGMRDLGNLGGTCTIVSDLNNRGQVIGQSSLATDQFVHAFLWDEERGLQDLGGSLGGSNTGAFVINEEGKAVGFAYLPGEIIFHATLWKHAGDMTDLGTVGNDQCSFATGINAKGQVVGGSKSTCDPEGGTARAFLWEDGSILDLNALILPGSGLHLESTYTINDQGEIAGEGTDTSGNGHAFLLVPCDENHAGVEGCDYSFVEAAVATPDCGASPTQKLATTPRTPGAFGPFKNIRRSLRRRPGPLSHMLRPITDSVDRTTTISRDSNWQLDDKLAVFDRPEPATSSRRRDHFLFAA
jgi:probable HAF family extracellular repeat protein